MRKAQSIQTMTVSQSQELEAWLRMRSSSRPATFFFFKTLVHSRRTTGIPRPEFCQSLKACSSALSMASVHDVRKKSPALPLVRLHVIRVVVVLMSSGDRDLQRRAIIRTVWRRDSHGWKRDPRSCHNAQLLQRHQYAVPFHPGFFVCQSQPSNPFCRRCPGSMPPRIRLHYGPASDAPGMSGLG